MNAKTTPYEVAELKKMNTVVLTRTFTRIAGYVPSEFIDRNMMVQIIWARQHAAEVKASVQGFAAKFNSRMAQMENIEANRKYSDNQIRVMVARWNNGQGDSINGLATEYHCSFNTMKDIVTRKSYKDVWTGVSEGMH